MTTPTRGFVMGADFFVTYESGKTAERAFSLARELAKREYGSCGYTGTIAEKDGFEVFPTKSAGDSLDEAYQLADRLEKWGPAGCFQVVDAEGDEPTWCFFGWASS